VPIEGGVGQFHKFGYRIGCHGNVPWAITTRVLIDACSTQLSLVCTELLDRRSEIFLYNLPKSQSLSTPPSYCGIPIRLEMPGRRMKASRPILTILHIKLVAMAMSLERSERGGPTIHLQSITYHLVRMSWNRSSRSWDNWSPINQWCGNFGASSKKFLLSSWKLRCYWTEVHQILTRCSGVIAAVDACIGIIIFQLVLVLKLTGGDSQVHFSVPKIN